MLLLLGLFRLQGWGPTALNVFFKCFLKLVDVLLVFQAQRLVLRLESLGQGLNVIFFFV